MLFYEKCEHSKQVITINQSSDIFQSVQKENQQFLIEKMLFEPYYIDFVEKVSFAYFHLNNFLIKNLPLDPSRM